MRSDAGFALFLGKFKVSIFFLSKLVLSVTGNFEDARRQMREELDLVRATEELATDGEERDYYGAMSRDLESCSANFDSYTAYSNRGTKLQLNL